ncbi:MAG: hypothetical protein GY803_08175 [Chloroflexi bacterium]|nr:hypothetical protein [Chloroflexota bacterium]
MEANELIERYVKEVGRLLPRKTREDIQLELNSLAHDALEERAADSGRAPTAEMAADVLRELGKPEDMAASYLPERYLIGPHLFPVYKLVLTIVLVVVGVSFMLGLILTLARSEPAEIGGKLWNIASGFWTAAVGNVGLITLIFAIIEYVGRQRKDVKVVTLADIEDWDPYKLPKVKDPDRIKRGELIFGVVFTILVIILFNVFPHWIGIITFTGDETEVFRLLAPEFSVHIPWLTVVWTAVVLLKLIVLGQGHWNRRTRWLEFVLDLFGLYVGYRIVTGGPIVTIDALTTLVRISIWIGLIVGGFEALGKLFKLAWGRPFTPAESIKSIKSKMA